MDLSEQAKKFAINAYQGQVRKIESDKPVEMHYINVGNILKKFGYDENVIAAGYIHDIIETTNYTFRDIKSYFNTDIAFLVYNTSEISKESAWKEKRQYILDKIKALPLRNKAVVCASIISDLEDIVLLFGKTDIHDLSKLNYDKEKQKYYHQSIYESLIYNEDKKIPIFKKYKQMIDLVFNYKENEFLTNIFSENIEYYNKLKKLHAYKQELLKIKSLCTEVNPFVIEFCGTPRTGKTSIINNLYDFFKKGGFDVKVISEFTTSSYYKEKLKPEFDKLSIYEKHERIIEEVYKQLLKIYTGDIVIIDKSINDRQIWNYRCFIKGDMTEEEFCNLKYKYSKLSKNIINLLVVTHTDSLTSLKRDYINSLALEDRKFLKTSNIEEYNKALIELNSLFNSSVSTYLKIDTTNIDINDTSIIVAEKVVKVMRKKYIEEFKKENK